MIVYVITRDQGSHLEPAPEVFAVMTSAGGAADAARVALADAPEARVVVLEYAADQLPADVRHAVTYSNR